MHNYQVTYRNHRDVLESVGMEWGRWNYEWDVYIMVISIRTYSGSNV